MSKNTKTAKTSTKVEPFINMVRVTKTSETSVRVPNPALYEQLPTKSAKIRAMAADIAVDDPNKTRSVNSAIALALNIRPQHVYNVLNSQLKRPTT